MKNRIFNLLKYYCVEPPYHKILSEVLWKCKLREFSHIKTKAAREHKANQYFLDKLAKINSYQNGGKIDAEIILNSFVHITLCNMDYGDDVYNELRKELYNRYGI